MSKQLKEIIEVYTRLLDYFFSGVMALVVFKTLKEELQGGEKFRDSMFIAAVFVSTYNTLILALANTVKPHDQSISIQYLFNCIRNSRAEFDADTYSRLLAYDSEFQQALATEYATIDAAVKMRDTLVAHLDRKHVNNPGSMRISPPVRVPELQRAFETIGGGLLELGKLLHQSDVTPYVTLSNFFLAQQTREVFRNLCAIDPGDAKERAKNIPDGDAG